MKFLKKLGLALGLMLVGALSASAQGGHYENILLTQQGKPVVNAGVYICGQSATGIPCSPIVTVYADSTLTIPKAQPISTGPYGNYDFWVSPGIYDVTIIGRGISSVSNIVAVACIPLSTCTGAAGPTFQVNEVNNASQAVVDMITSTVNAAGLTVTPSNPSGGKVKLEITGSQPDCTSTVHGLVPAPPNTAGKYLDGTCSFSYPQPLGPQTFNPFASGEKADAVIISPVDLSGGGSTLVSSGLFSSSLVGKVGSCLLVNDIGSFGTNGSGALFTVTSFVDTSHITISLTIGRAFANQSCTFASTNLRTALTTTQAAVTDGSTLQLPCGRLLYSGGQIFSAFAKLSSGNTLNIAGCPNKGTIIDMDYASVATTTTPMMASPSGIILHIHDIIFTSVGELAYTTNTASNVDGLFTLSTGGFENVEADNWTTNTCTATCAMFKASQDGSTWHNVTFSNCFAGLHVYDKLATFIQDNGANIGSGCTTSLVIEGQEDGNNFVGGSYITPIQIVGNAQAVATTLNFYGVSVGGASGATPFITTTAGTGPLNINWWGGGGAITGAPTNVTGITLASTTVFRPHGMRLDSKGTGYSVNSSGGVFFDDGTNFSPNIGTGWYTGTGNVNGKSLLSGSAYTNATTTFSGVVGSAGETLAWTISAAQTLNVTCKVMWSSSSVTGPKFQFTGPASPTAVTQNVRSPLTNATYIDVPGSTSAFSSSMAVAGVVTTGTNFIADVTLGVINGANAGTIALQAAANGAATTISILPGSYCQSN